MFVPRGEFDPVYFILPITCILMARWRSRYPGNRGSDVCCRGSRDRTPDVEPARADGHDRAARHRDGARYIGAADEVRAPHFTSADGAIDAEMLATARPIIEQQTGKFDAGKFRDRYQEALRELVDAKMKGLPIKPREVSTPAPVIDLMAALKRSLTQGSASANNAKPIKRAKAAPDRRQRAMLLPVSGGRKNRLKPTTEPVTVASTRRKKA
jgi:hypothetical protein